MSLYIGNSHWAYAAVVGSFMCGLALGNWLGGIISKRADGSNLLKYYSFIEIGIAFGALLSYIFTKAAEYALLSLGVVELPSVIQSAVWFVSGFVIILTPTIFIGATLPVMSQWYIKSFSETGKKIGVLYSANTIGAVGGILLAGFYLIQNFGLFKNFVLAGSLNIVCALLAFYIASLSVKEPLIKPKAATIKKSEPDVIAVPLFLLSGAAAMICQIAWTRLLILIIGSSTYAYTVILAVYIAGLAAGSAFYAKYSNSSKAACRILKPSWLNAGVLFSFLGIVIAAGLYYGERLFYIFLKLMPIGAYKILPLELVYFVVCSFMIFAPTFLMGAIFPLFISAVTKQDDVVGENVGVYTSINTVGAVLGVISVVFLLIPYFGIEKTLVISGLLYALIAFAAIYNSKHRFRYYFAFGFLVLITALNIFRSPWDERVLSSGVFLYAPQYNRAKTFGEFKTITHRTDLIYHKDGNSATVTVLDNEVSERFLRINGKTEASSGDDMSTQMMVGYLPLFYRSSNPENALIVGLGSGVTAGVITNDKGIKKIDCVELEKSVANAAAFFGDYNRYVLKDPRLDLILTDGRHYLNGTKSRYDLIISEPSNPWIAGVSNLFTRQAFQTAKNKLSAGGIFAQWLHSYAMGESDFKMICATFLDVFPDAALFSPKEFDFVLLGSNEPLVFDYERVEKMLFENPAITQDILACGIPNTFALLATTFMLEGKDLKKFAGGAPILKDDKITLEFTAPRNLYGGDTTKIEEAIESAKIELLPANVKGLNFSKAHWLVLYNQTGEFFMRQKKSRHALEWFNRAEEADPSDPRTLTNLGRVASLENKDIQAEKLYLQALKAGPDYALAYFHLGQLYVIQGMESKGIYYLEKGLQYSPADSFATASLAGIYEKNGLKTKARAIYERALKTPNIAPALQSEFQNAINKFK